MASSFVDDNVRSITSNQKVEKLSVWKVDGVYFEDVEKVRIALIRKEIDAAIKSGAIKSLDEVPDWIANNIKMIMNKVNNMT